jgi:hypothetical protein
VPEEGEKLPETEKKVFFSKKYVEKQKKPQHKTHKNSGHTPKGNYNKSRFQPASKNDDEGFDYGGNFDDATAAGFDKDGVDGENTKLHLQRPQNPGKFVSNFPDTKFYLPALRDGYTRFIPIG